jgi:uncharacterized protein YjbI with pentapeptide repeats
MISSTVTIQLYPAEGRQWATVIVEGSDDPNLTLAEAVKALGAELSRFYITGAPPGAPLDLGSLESSTSTQVANPVSVSSLLGLSDGMPWEAHPVAEDILDLPPVEVSAGDRQQQYELAKTWKVAGGRSSLRGFDLSHQDLSGVDLAGADLSQSNLEGAKLTNANLEEANLSGAILSVATVAGASLKNADLSEANLVEVDLSKVNLEGADLARSNLTEATLRQTNLSQATLTKAVLSQANMVRVNLSRANSVVVRDAGYSGSSPQEVRSARLSDRP